MKSDDYRHRAKTAWDGVRGFLSETEVEFTGRKAVQGQNMALTVTTAKWGTWSWNRPNPQDTRRRQIGPSRRARKALGPDPATASDWGAALVSE